MRSSKRFTFHLRYAVGNNTPAETIVRPAYKDLTHSYTKESGEEYCTESCDSEFTFGGSDFVLIRNCDIRTKFTLIVYDNGSECMRGSFRKTDGETDINHNTFKVKISIDNKYGMTDKFDDEYDLKKLNPPMSNLSFRVKPVLQVYELFSDKCYNYCGTECYVKDVTPIEEMDRFWRIFPFGSENALAAYEWFASCYLNASVSFSDGTTRNCTGVYKCNGTPTETIEQGERYFVMYMENQSLPQYRIQIKIQAKDAAALYSGAWESVRLWLMYGNPTATAFGCSYYNSSSSAMSILRMSKVTMKNSHQYSTATYTDILQYFHFGFVVKRLLINSSSIPQAYERNYAFIGDDDPLIVSENYNAIYIYTPSFGSVASEYSGYSSTPTEYGLMNDQTNYYASPGEGYMPMVSTSWASNANATMVISWWISRAWENDSAFSTLVADLTVTKMLQDWYSLGGVIKVLLGQIDSSIVFDADTSHSDFLFNTTNPVTSESQGNVYILQKSNILNFDYDMAAWKCPITFNNVLNLLKNAFNCYWDIYESNNQRHFRIEHVSFYMNGKTYGTDSRTAIDLTDVTDNRNGKPSSFITNHWTYDSESQARRYEFSWMDKQTNLFDGQAIEIRDEENMFSDAKKEERNIEFFSSDMDAMMFDTDSFSQDGFVVAKAAPMTTEINGVKPIAITNITLNGVTHKLQNGQMSMAWLQEKFLKHNMYPKAVLVNGHISLVPMRKRMRSQEISFFVPSGTSVKAGDLVETEVGIGEIDSMSVDMTCGLIKATVKYAFESYSGEPTPVTPTITNQTIYDAPLRRINRLGNNTITRTEINDLVAIVDEKPNRNDVVLQDNLSISQTDDEVSITFGGTTYTTLTSDYADYINDRVTNIEQSLPTEAGVVEYISTFGYDGRTAAELPNAYVALAASAYSHDKLFLVDNSIYAAKSIGSDIQPYLEERGWHGAELLAIQNAVGCDTNRKKSVCAAVVNFMVSNNTINQTGSLYYYEMTLLPLLMNAVTYKYDEARMAEATVLARLGLQSATNVYYAVLDSAISKHLVFRKNRDVWWQASNHAHIGEGIVWLVQAQEIISRHERIVSQFIEVHGPSTDTELSENCGQLNPEGYSYEPISAMYMSTEDYPGDILLMKVDGQYSFRT